MSQSRIFKKSFYYMAASFLPMAVNFVLLPVFTRYLSPQDYGILALIQCFIAFLPIILSLQIQSSVGRFYFEYSGDERNILISTIGLALLFFSSISLVLLFVFFSEILSFIFPKVPTSMYVLFRLALLASFFNTLTEISKILLRVREEAKLFMKISLSLFFVGLAVSIIEVVILRKGAYGVVEASLILAILSFIIFIFFNRSFLVLSFNLKMLKGPIKYSLPIIPHALAGIIFMYSDRIIMEKYVLLSAIGIYSLADKIAMLFKTMVNQLHSAFQPHFIKTATVDRNKAVEDAKNTARTTVFFSSFMILIGAIFSVEILYYFLDERYFKAWIMIPILASSYVFRSLYCFGSCGLFFERKTGRVAIITIVAAIVNIMINLLFIPKYGVIVAVFSTMASFIVTYLMAVIMSINSFYIRLDNKANLLFIGYMYCVIILAFFINSGFTLENPSLPLNAYVLKIFVLIFGLYLGLKMKVLKFRLFSTLWKAVQIDA